VTPSGYSSREAPGGGVNRSSFGSRCRGEKVVQDLDRGEGCQWRPPERPFRLLAFFSGTSDAGLTKTGCKGCKPFQCQKPARERCERRWNILQLLSLEKCSKSCLRASWHQMSTRNEKGMAILATKGKTRPSRTGASD
jgi:hypothetical protein